MTMGLLIGVTGAIGAGKSTVCRMLSRAGRTVLSADQLAREIMESDQQVLADIRSAFGDEVFTPEGVPDRSVLARRVFGDAELLARLNAIVHPPVIRTLERRLAELPASARNPYAAVEAALIYETGMDRSMDYVVVVQASERARIARVTARDNVRDADVRRRMRAQMPASLKAERADFLIENDGGEEDLLERVLFIDRLLVSIAGSRKTPEAARTPRKRR